MVNTEEKRYCVYCHTSPSGKRYVGITCQKPEHRWLSDGNGYKIQPVMWRAIQKYGFDNFQHEILFSGLTEKEATAREVALIAEFRTMEREFGYNRTLGGDGVGGSVWTDERKKAFSEKMTGHPVSEETKEKLRQKRKNYIMPQHVLDAAHAASRGRKQSPEEIEKRCAKLRGRKMSDKFKAMASERMRGENNHGYGKKQSAETVAKRVASRSGYKHSNETKEKIRQGNLDYKNHMCHRESFYNQREVGQYDLSGSLIARFKSINCAVRATGFPQSCIQRCCAGARKTTHGFIWKYA